MPEPTPYTGEQTRILLSFAMDQHGSLFAHWLREKLMHHYGYYSRNAVYMDCIAARGRDTVHGTAGGAMPRMAADATFVSPDTREKFQSQGYMPIGARNASWNEMYQQAMREARAMIMVVTPEYMASEWCMLEWAQFDEENTRRRGAGQSPLRGVALQFPVTEPGDAPSSGLPTNGSRIAVVAVTKVKNLGGMLWHPESFGISDEGFSRLVQALGRNL